jgi:hypothetical protein
MASGKFFDSAINVRGNMKGASVGKMPIFTEPPLLLSKSLTRRFASSTFFKILHACS